MHLCTAGLSYTTFAYKNLKITRTAGGSNAGGSNAPFAVVVTIDVANTGKVAGAEVAQLYVAFPPAAGEPPQQLKGFVKTRVLTPGATAAAVTFGLRARDLSVWDEDARGWRVQVGQFGVGVGASSRDIRAKGEFTVSGRGAEMLITV